MTDSRESIEVSGVREGEEYQMTREGSSGGGRRLGERVCTFLMGFRMLISQHPFIQ